MSRNFTHEGDTKIWKTKVRLFDADKKELIGEFESQYLAAKHLGVSEGHINAAKKYKSIIKKSSNKLGLRIAVR